ncbi:MAG: phosphatidate cytidylyltransferase [Pelagibacterales bacterium]|nr:phosphatidate cytidylyltransferase [Pelagibacterales bacterium]
MKNEMTQRIVTSLILLFIFFLMLINQFILVATLLFFFIFSFLEFSALIQKICAKKKLLVTLYNSLFFLYIFIFLLIFYFFLQDIGTKFLLLFYLSLCISSDIGGIIFGKIFKGPKLTKISPNKTISGSVGSFVLSAATCYLLVYFTQVFVFNKIIILALFISLGCQIGDIFFSYLKRKANVKDTGKVLPGHGGLLDRFDGILFGLPFSLLGTVILYIFIT